MLYLSLKHLNNKSFKIKAFKVLKYYGRKYDVCLNNLKEHVACFQKSLIKDVLARSSGNWSKAVDLLQMDRGNLHRLVKRLHKKCF